MHDLNSGLAQVIQNVVSVMLEPDSDSEIVTQAIMGETVSLVDVTGDWQKILMEDGCEGYVRRIALTERELAPIFRKVAVSEVFVPLYDELAQLCGKMTIGSVLCVTSLEPVLAVVALANGQKAGIPISSVHIPAPDQPVFPLPGISDIADAAKLFIGTPYLWGGRSAFGLDCSGLVSLCYKLLGKTVPRNSYLQASCPQAAAISDDERRVGDLVFFSAGKKRVDHVGIALDSKSFIHSCGARGVSICDFNEPYYAGIYWGSRRMVLP